MDFVNLSSKSGVYQYKLNHNQFYVLSDCYLSDLSHIHDANHNNIVLYQHRQNLYIPDIFSMF